MQAFSNLDKEIYLDNSATTALDDRVREKMIWASYIYGNPSSLHSAGLAAEKLVSAAREEVLAALGARGAKAEELVFCASGTEANNLALAGTAYAKKRRARTKIITSDSEHPSVLRTLERLSEDGFEVVKIPTAHGALDLAELEREADDRVLLASFMLVNNETGALYDVKKAFSIVKRASPEAVTHCDAVQGFLKVNFSPASLGAELVTVSSHKIHGPKGVGALYVCPGIIKAKKIVPVTLGGGQEHGFRSGTENTMGIAGFGEAARLGRENFGRDSAYMRSLRDRLASKLQGLGFKLNLPPVTAPHILSVTLPDIKSETMLHFLSSEGIFVSSGSACSSHSGKPSATLVAFGLSPEEADHTLRVSFSHMNTEEDVSALVSALEKGISRLAKTR